MSGYWSALARAAGESLAGAERALPRKPQPFEDLHGLDEDGFVEVDPEPAGLPASMSRPIETPAEYTPSAAIPRATVASDAPQTLARPNPMAVADLDPVAPVAAPDRLGEAPAVAAAPSPTTPPHQPPAIDPDRPQPLPDVPAHVVTAAPTRPVVAPDVPAATASPDPAAPPPAVSVAATPSTADPTDAVQALPAIIVSALAEQLAQSVATIEPAAPPPILITIDQLEIRLGDQGSAPAPAHRERPAPLVPLDRFLRRTGDSS